MPVLTCADGRGFALNSEYLIAGHSHVFAMGAPFDYDGPPSLLRTEDGAGYFVMEKWKDASGLRSTAYWEKLIDVCRGRDVLLSYRGNQHHAKFLFEPNPLFDVFDEVSPEFLDDARLVPRRLIEACFAPTMNELRSLVARLIAADCRCVRLVGAPPPKADLHVLFEMLRTSDFAREVFKREGVDIERAKITPVLLLLKLWRIVESLTAAVATHERVAFVAVPCEALDEQGYLAKRFYDYTLCGVTHANREFGRLMIQRALQTL